MASCEKDIRDAANTATDCPADTDLVLFVPQSGASVFRTWAKVKECLGGGVSFGEPLNVYVGSVDYPDPFTVFDITVTAPKEHSLSVFLDGVYIPNDVEGQISYTPSYQSDKIEVTFNQETKIGQLYTFRYAYQV